MLASGLLFYLTMQHLQPIKEVSSLEEKVAERVASVMAQVEKDLLRLMVLQSACHGLGPADPQRGILDIEIREIGRRIQENRTKAAEMWF